MKYVIKIECDNAAFEDAGVHREVGRILKRVIERNRAAGELQDMVLHDENGNKVGEAEVWD